MLDFLNVMAELVLAFVDYDDLNEMGAGGATTVFFLKTQSTV